MIRFMHTGDWQLGMTRHFLTEGAQERFTQSRFDAIRTLGRIAKEEGCQFIVVCGDVFESNQVDRRTVVRSLEAMKEILLPVYLLPGNHDPLNEGSIYRSSTFLERKPAHVHVVENMDPIVVIDGIEIVGAPWPSKRPLRDLVAAATSPLSSSPNLVRICIAHGAVDSLNPNPNDPASISLSAAEEAISQGKIHYLGLGDRHSLTEVGKSGRIWYAGAPEPTDYDEVKSGFALVVELDQEQISTKHVQVGTWRFIERERVDINTAEDLGSFRAWFELLEKKERVILKVRMVGTLSLSLYGQLEILLSNIGELLGALETRMEDLVVIPEAADFSEFGFSGFTSMAVERLRLSAGEAKSNIPARDALALLVRLTEKIK